MAVPHSAGYWALGHPYLNSTEPYETGQWPYLMRALSWARILGMQAIICLHGAPGRYLRAAAHQSEGRSVLAKPPRDLPYLSECVDVSVSVVRHTGSQNGNDNSGKKGAIKWHTGNNINRWVL